MSQYHLTRRAARDLDRIIDELDRISLTAGNRVLSAFRQKAEKYALDPLHGILRDDVGPDLRCFLVFQYLGFYRLVADGIEVIRFLHGHQNIEPSMFQP